MLKSREAHAYANAVRRHLGPHRQAVGPVVVWLVWGRARKAGDLDNRAKALLDCLQGELYRNDSQIVEMHAFRRESPGRPYLLLGVRTLE